MCDATGGKTIKGTNSYLFHVKKCVFILYMLKNAINGSLSQLVFLIQGKAKALILILLGRQIRDLVLADPERGECT